MRRERCEQASVTCVTHRMCTAPHARTLERDAACSRLALLPSLPPSLPPSLSFSNSLDFLQTWDTGAATGSPSKQLLVELQAASITDLSQDVADMQAPPAAAAAQAAAPEAAEVSGHGTVGLLSDVVGGVAELSLDAGDEEGAGDAGDDGAVVEGEAGEDVGDTGKKKKKKNKGKASKDLVVQASVERQGGKGGGGGECEEAEEDDGDRLQEVPVTPKAQQVPSSDDMVDLLTDE